MRLSHFRALVVTAWLLYVFYSFYPYLPVWATPYVTWLGAYDTRLIDLLRGGGYGALYVTPDLLNVVIWWSWLIAAIGMIFLQNWARYLYLGLLVAGFIQLALSGIATLTPFQSVLLGLLNVLDGVVLAIALFSPLKSHFGAHAPSNTTMERDARNPTARPSL